MKAVIYLRISTNTQNLDFQKKACQLKAKLLGIKRKLIFSDIISGSSNAFERAGLMDAILSLKKDDAFIVYDRKRIARNMTIVSAIEKMIKDFKAKLVVVIEAKELTRYEKHYLDLLAQKAAINIRTKTGIALKGKKKSSDISVDIKKIKQLKKRGLTMLQIVEFMNQDELCNKNRKPYTYNQIKKILSPSKRTANNPSYGTNLNEEQMIQAIYQMHDNHISFRNIVKLVNELGYKTRTNTPLQLTQIARIIKKRSL
jgi:DNA invertase Pin-like site-specific DNA recombinase